MVFTTNIQTDVDVSVTFYNLCYRGGGVKLSIFILQVDMSLVSWFLTNDCGDVKFYPYCIQLKGWYKSQAVFNLKDDRSQVSKLYDWGMSCYLYSTRRLSFQLFNLTPGWGINLPTCANMWNICLDGSCDHCDVSTNK